ncbi:glycoside hydrolase family 16 protein [Arthrobacter sp. CJ23]|uniref:glycoside hydrolase family 16 protein n=1 Tax=Arthrobacter sp. CJ23 TaxID=2972479 RepID=UPI00215C6507|nr:glycoside hydrolase family 16 protein [Arthrobacter sp. CJ23]UVJ39573.1 glycoside hydrolase family 16 protein [Arthrobacter sp. CJ23]
MVVLAVAGVMFLRSADSPSGMPVGDLPGWKQTGAQDFATPAPFGHVEDVYGPEVNGYSGFTDSSGRGTYAPDSVLSVADGRLDYFLHTADGGPQVASVIPFGYTGQKYGRYSIRFRYDPMPGYKIAFLLWPASDNWNEGEIDWPEGSLDGPLYGASAIKGSFANGAMEFDPPRRTFAPGGPGDWHVATTEWTPGNVSWFMDGALIDQTTVPSGVPDTPMRWTLQAETSDRASRDFPEAAVSGHLQIDWVVQYAYAP